MPESFARDYANEIEFERFAISAATPLAAESNSSISADIYLDGRPGQVRLAASVTVGRSNSDVISELKIRPLLFGAAWKILDILIDYVLQKASPTRRFTIKEKVECAAEGRISFSPLNEHPEIMERVLAVYVNDVQYRHALIHRRASASENGDFTGHNDCGKPLPRLTILEQEAFCRAALCVASAVADGVLPTRNLHRLASEIDALQHLTLKPKLNFPPLNKQTPVVTVHVSSAHPVDFSAIKSKVYSTFPTASHVDLILAVEDLPGVRYSSELERTPDLRLTLGANTDVPWLKRL